RIDLSANGLDQLTRRDVHRHAPEPLAVRIAGMCTDRDAVPQRELDRGAHGVLVPSVTTARDVRARDERHDRGVGPRAFAQITIEVNRAWHAEIIERGAAPDDRAATRRDGAGGTGERVVREPRVPRGPTRAE